MKKFYYILVFLVISAITVFAQNPDRIANGGCDEVSYSFAIPYVPTFGIYSYWWHPKQNCAVITPYAYPLRVRYYLQRKDSNGNFVDIAGPKTDGTPFTGVANGTYRIKYMFPNRIPCNIFRPQESGFIQIYLTNGQYIGHWGSFWDGIATFEYSNEVLVGPTNSSDIAFEFVNINAGFAPAAYDYGDQVDMDMSGSKNYNMYWIGIAEQGPVYNRTYNPGLDWLFRYSLNSRFNRYVENSRGP